MLPMLLATIENDADRALFAEIYEQYHERMEQAALRILKDTHDAEDAVQNAFLKIIRNFEKFLELPCKKRPFWCVCIVKNEAITLLRKKKKAIMLESMEDAYDASADIEKALSYEDIIRLFAGLPETYRAVLGRISLRSSAFQKMRSMYAFPAAARCFGRLWKRRRCIYDRERA